MGRGGKIDEYNKHRDYFNINILSNRPSSSNNVFFSVFNANNIFMDRN